MASRPTGPIQTQVQTRAAPAPAATPAVQALVAPPTLRIMAGTPSRAEGSTGTTSFTFIVTRSSGVGASSASWSVVHGTTLGADFSGPISGTVSFAAGETSKTISVNVVGDLVVEANETFSVQLSAPNNATLTTASATSTILNDDRPRLHIVANTPNVDERTSAGGTTPVTFTVTRDTGIGTSTVGWSVVHRSTSVSDFSGATSGKLSFAVGETTKTVTVNVVADALIEANEFFDVVLSSPVGATVITATASAMVINDDIHTLSIAATTPSRNEGNTGTTPFTFTVTRSVGVGTSTVNWSVVHGTTNAADFSGATSGSVTFASGQTSRVITVYALGDTVFEGNEAFSVQLASPVNARIVNGTAGATIVNDDAAPAPVLSIAATDASKVEGSTGATAFTFTVTRSSGVGASTANWSTVHGATDAADFSGTTTGTVSFAAGETSKTITVNVVGDTTVETVEAFSVQLSSPTGATLGTSTATATILNDDLASVTLTSGTQSAYEGNSGTTPFAYTVTRDSGIGTASVSYSVSGGTAQPDDFSGSTTGQVVFGEGETSKVVTLNVAGDTVVEADESFAFVLTNPSNLTLNSEFNGTMNTRSGYFAPDGSVVYTTIGMSSQILNDDTAVVVPTVSITATDTSKTEGNSGTTAFTFTVTRSSGTGASSVSYQVNTPMATADDFAGSTSGTVSFAAGETAKTITVNVVGDTLVEGDETFYVQLFSPVNATLGNATASSTILNDDMAVTPTLSITTADTSKAEGNAGSTPFSFTVTRSAGTGISSVNWLLAGGGTNAADFAAGTPFGVNSTLTFAAGETSKTITVNVAGDTTQESDETFSVQLSSPTNALLGTSSATATLLDDDTPVISIAATDADKLEGTGTNPVMTFTISRSLSTGTSSVSYTVVAGTATAGSDYYGTTSNYVTFANGETSKTITVNISGDSAIEPDETFQVVLSSPSGGRIGVGTATATIRNDDRAGIDGSAALVTNIAVPTAVDDSIENLVETTKWGGTIGTGAQLTYSFSTASSVFTYASGSEVPYASLNAAQKVAAVMAMNAITAICGVTFTEVPDTATSAGDIRWTQSLNGALSTAHAYYPSSWAGGGDVWIGPDASYTNPVVGGYSYHTFIHELGHSMGLNHPHQGSPVPELNEDQLKYSVMSYRDNPAASTGGGYTSNYYPTDYMLNDVLALQYLYGVNTTSNQGDTVYQWDAASKVYDCIWDVGGNDTIDASNQSVACAVNLNGGTWSTIGATYYNGAGQVNNSLSIAYEVTGVAGVSNVIENAIGSAQADTLIGNSAANRLTGGSGADTLTGSGGADTFFFASIAQGGDTITDFVSGTDRIEVYSTNFASLAVGTLVSSRFVSGAAPVALDGNAVFLYNSSNGQLSFDSNGTAAGGTTLLALLSGAASLNAGDIRIVATSS
jgi:Ca2+-binding RTX toxin-like protein